MLSKAIGHRGALVLAAACWGLATVMSKAVLAHLPPLTLMVIQLTTSVLFLWALLLPRRLSIAPGEARLAIGLTGLLNPGLAYTLGLLGLSLTSASMASLLWAAEPVLILLLAWLVLRESLAPSTIALSALALFGVFLVAGYDGTHAAGTALLGNTLVLAAVLCCALYVIFTRRLVTAFDPLVLIALQQSVALVWALLIWPLELWAEGWELLRTIAPATWGWAALSGLLYYALAFWLYVTGLQRVPANIAALFINLVPIFAVGGAYLFLGEHLLPTQQVGALLIVIAVMAIFSGQREKKVAAH